MGVSSLWELLNRAGKKCELASLANKRLAVDTSIWLTQFVKGMRTEDGGPVENAHLRGLFTRVCKLLYFGIRPVFVFDGGKPALKQDTLVARAQARRRMDSSARSMARELLLQRVKKRVLTLKDADGNLLGEAEVRQMLASLEATAKEMEEADDGQAPVLPPLASHPPRVSRARLEELEAHNALDEKLRDYEYTANQLPLQQSGLLFSNLQFENLVGSLQERKQDQNVITGDIQSEPGRQFVFLKGDNVGVPVQPAKKAKTTEELFFVDDVFVDDANGNADFEEESFQSAGDGFGNDTGAEQAIGFGDQKEPGFEFDGEEEAEWEDAGENPRVSIPAVRGRVEESVLRQHSVRLSPKRAKSVEIVEGKPDNLSVTHNDSIVPEKALKASVQLGSARSSAELAKERSASEERSEYSSFVDRKRARVEVDLKDFDDNLGDNDFGNDDDGEEEGQEEEEEGEEEEAEGGVESEESSSFEDLSVLEAEKKAQLDAEPGKDVVFGEFDIPAAAGSSEEDPNVYWACSLCSYHNSFEFDSCQVCSGPMRPGPVADTAVVASHSHNFIDPSNFKGDLAASSAGQLAPSSPILPANAGSHAALQGDIEARERQLVSQANAQERMIEGVDPVMIQESKDLLALFGIPWVDAPMEAEAQCAALEMLQLVDGVVSEDSDVFLVGAQNVYKNLFRAAHHPQQYRMVDVAATLGMNRFTFIQLAYFLGSDYTVGIKGVGIVLAVEILSEFKSDDDEMEKIEVDEDGADWKGVVDTCLKPLRAFRDWFLDGSSTRAKGLRRRLAKILLPETFPDKEIAIGYLRPDVDEGRDAFSWGKPRWTALKTFAMDVVKWSEDKVDSLLDPIADRLNELEASGKITQKTMLEFFSAQAKDIPLQVTSERLARAIAKFKGERYVGPEKEKKTKKKAPSKRRKKAAEGSEEKGKRPKRARSAYSFFMAEKSKALRSENPSIPFAEVSKACGAQWALLEDRSKYVALARADKKRRAAELDELVEEEEEDDDDEVDEVILFGEDEDDAILPQPDREEPVLEGDLPKQDDAVRVPSIDDGPPFSRDLLEGLKMPKLRMLCHRYNLKPAVRKVDVISQLCMLKRVHRPVSTVRMEEGMTRGARRLEREEALDAWDRALDQLSEEEKREEQKEEKN